MKNHCLCIYPKDVQRVLGRSYRASSMVIQKIKKHLGKQSFQPVTIEEFCTYMNLPLKEVEARVHS